MKRLQADKHYLLSPDYLTIGAVDGMSQSDMTQILETVKHSVTPKEEVFIREEVNTPPQPPSPLYPKEDLPPMVQEVRKMGLPHLEQITESVFSSPMNITTPLNSAEYIPFEPMKKRPDIELNLEEQNSQRSQSDFNLTHQKVLRKRSVISKRLVKSPSKNKSSLLIIDPDQSDSRIRQDLPHELTEDQITPQSNNFHKLSPRVDTSTSLSLFNPSLQIKSSKYAKHKVRK